MKKVTIVVISLYLLLFCVVGTVQAATYGFESATNQQIIGLTPHMGAHWQSAFMSSGIRVVDTWSDGHVDYFRLSVSRNGGISFYEYMNGQRIGRVYYNIKLFRN